MKKIFVSSLFLVVILSFSSCKNDLNILAPYKEIPSVYAVLTPQENLQMIRVNKVFLGEGNAFDMAKVADSINYKPGELTIKLEHYVNGVKSPSASFNGNSPEIVFRDSVITTQPGAFNTTQRVYVTNERLKNFGDYQLTVKNNSSGSVYIAKSTVLDSVNGNSFPPFVTPYYKLTPTQISQFPPSNAVYTNSVYIDYSGTLVNHGFRIITIPNAKLYETRFRVHYDDSVAGGFSGKGYMDFTPGSATVLDMKAGERLNFNFRGGTVLEGFKTDLQARNIQTGSGLIGRIIRYIEISCVCAGQDYWDYLQYAAPSQTIAQDKKLYTNFSGGAYGLFAFRSRCSVKKEMLNNFIDAIAFDRNTCSYKFLNSNKVWPGCP